MGRAEFPLVVRLGQTRATIYRTPSHGSEAFTVCWYEGATRKRKTFPEIEAARLHATTTVHALARGEPEVVRLSGEERLECLRARDAVREFGLSLDSAASEYRDAKRILQGGSLIDAARFFAKSRIRDAPSRTVQEAVAEILQAKSEAGLSKRYLQDLRSRLGEFARDFQCPLHAVTGPQIRSWLQAKPVSNRTRNNSRLAIQTLCTFAVAQRYLPRDWNEMEAVPVWKTPREEVEVFTPEELRTLLSIADSKMIPFLAIGAFAGLRTAEIERLDWRDVDFSSGYIRVAAAQAKTGSRRLVPILENLQSWLLPHAHTMGPVVELANLPNGIQRLVRTTESRDGDPSLNPSACTPKWKHNGLRHSFCSYRLAIIKNAAQVALEAGNSPSIIFQHYRELVTERQANEWFAIVPK